jgi:hypothetical protein
MMGKMVIRAEGMIAIANVLLNLNSINLTWQGCTG